MGSIEYYTRSANIKTDAAQYLTKQHDHGWNIDPQKTITKTKR